MLLIPLIKEQIVYSIINAYTLNVFTITLQLSKHIKNTISKQGEVKQE